MYFTVYTFVDFVLFHITYERILYKIESNQLRAKRAKFFYINTDHAYGMPRI